MIIKKREVSSIDRKIITVFGIRLENITVYLVSGIIFVAGLSYLYLAIRTFGISSNLGYNSAVFTYAIIGFGLTYVAFSLFNRVYRSWFWAIILLALAMIFEVFFVDIPNRFEAVSVHGSLLLMLLFSKSQFTTLPKRHKFSKGIISGVLLVCLVLGYGIFGYYYLNPEGGILIATKETFKTVFLTTFSLNFDYPEYTQFANHLRVVGSLGFVVIALLFFEPLRIRKIGGNFLKERAQSIIDQYGGSSEDFFKFFPDDKDYIISPDSKAFIAYKEKLGVAVGLGDPVGDMVSMDSLMNKYKTYCRVQGIAPALIHVTDKFRHLYEKHGMIMQKIGQSAVVDNELFVSKTSRSKNWRNINNRFKKSGYEFQIYRPPHSSELMGRLKNISDDWLSKPGRTERTFIIGYFDRNYIGSCDLGVVKDSGGKIISFLNIVKTYDPEEATIDLFRQSLDAPSNTTDFMISSLIYYLHDNNYKKFNLGLSPLVGVDGSEDWPSKVINLIYNNANKIYSFKGLYLFKKKFDPDWRDIYVTHESDGVGILKIASGFLAASTIDKKTKKL